MLAFGTVANALPQLIYGAMPFLTSSALQAGFSEVDVRAVGRHVPVTDQPSWIVALSDVVPIPGIMKVVSVGDVAIIAGLILVLVGLVREPDRSLAIHHTSALDPSAVGPPDARPPARR